MFENEKAKEYEKYFLKEHEESHMLLSGNRTIMISAPHSVFQTRNDKLKSAERETGVLALMLHDELDCPVIVKTKNCNDDANFDAKSPYKDDLVKYIKSNGIKFLIDLHQLSPKRDIIFDVGTSNLIGAENGEILNLILKCLTQKKLGILQINKLYDGSYPYTVSAHVSKTCNVPSIQLEMNTKLFATKKRGNHLKDVYEALENFILELEKII